MCLDARKLISVTIPDYECTVPINEILAHCSEIKIMTSINLKNSFWQIPLKTVKVEILLDSSIKARRTDLL